MNKNKLTPEIVDNYLYGPDGLYKRIIDKIDELNKEAPRKASIMLGVSTQAINSFKQPFYNNNYGKPKVNRLATWAKKLGVE